MLPGPILYLSCPKCQTITSRPSISSGNTFGARRWTDGKMTAKMLPEYTDIIKCMSCHSFFWIDDAEVIEWDFWSGEENPLPKDLLTHEARDLTEEEYIEAINGNVANIREREVYLRVRLWWTYNDQLRESTHTNKGKDGG